MPFAATQMSLKIIIKQIRRRKIIYVESKKVIQIHLQNKNRFTGIENKLVVTKDEIRGGTHLEFGTNRHTLLCIKQVNKDLLYSTGNCIQYRVITYNVIEQESLKHCKLLLYT